MKKLVTLVGLVALMVVAIGVVLADEVVPFPFWQHGYGVTTFWSVSNIYGNIATVTINLLLNDGTLVQATTGTVSNFTAWMPDTGSWGGWYTSGDQVGFGYFYIQSQTDSIYLWSAVYGLLPQGQTGFTIVLPQNPYGVPSSK